MIVQFIPLTPLEGVEYSITVLNPVLFIVAAHLKEHTTGFDNPRLHNIVPPAGFDNSNLIGYTTIGGRSNLDIAVHPDFRNKKIGTDLCHKAEEHLGTFLDRIPNITDPAAKAMSLSYKSAADGLNADTRKKKSTATKKKIEYGLKEI